jgi:uncharacterized protein (DUF58 family)
MAPGPPPTAPGHLPGPARPWHPTRALRRSFAVAAVALLAAATLGRPGLVLLAAPFAVGAALSLVRRPGRVPVAALRLDREVSVEGGPVTARVPVRNDEDLTMLCVVSAEVSTWIRLRHGTGHYATLLRPAGTTQVRLEGTTTRWGRQQVGPATVRVYACDGLLAGQRTVVPASPLAVYPTGDRFDSGQMLPHAAGVSGVHRARRLGQGGELADVRPFQAGDRLRRINWRVTGRTGEIHVNSTLPDRDADVVLVLDARHEAGRSGGVGGPASVLDATVRAAAAIMEHYAHQGDRVALVELSTRLRRLPAGTGRRHFLAALDWLLQISVRPTGLLPGDRLFTRGLQPVQALLIVLTPLLDYHSAWLLAGLARTGRPLVAVDTLPPEVRVPPEGPWSAAGERLWRLERANTLGRLREVGVAVQRWQGPGSLDQLLRHVYRLSMTSRVLTR